MWNGFWIGLRCPAMGLLRTFNSPVRKMEVAWLAFLLLHGKWSESTHAASTSQEEICLSGKYWLLLKRFWVKRIRLVQCFRNDCFVIGLRMSGCLEGSSVILTERSNSEVSAQTWRKSAWPRGPSQCALLEPCCGWATSQLGPLAVWPGLPAVVNMHLLETETPKPNWFWLQKPSCNPSYLEISALKSSFSVKGKTKEKRKPYKNDTVLWNICRGIWNGFWNSLAS